jgi:hypothetical protein
MKHLCQIELILSAFILLVLSIVAYGTIQNYTRESAYFIVVQTANKLKPWVESCLATPPHQAQRCSIGHGGIPVDFKRPRGVESIRIHHGRITITPQKSVGAGIDPSMIYSIQAVWGVQDRVEWQYVACDNRYTSCE